MYYKNSIRVRYDRVEQVREGPSVTGKRGASGWILLNKLYSLDCHARSRLVKRRTLLTVTGCISGDILFASKSLKFIMKMI